MDRNQLIVRCWIMFTFNYWDIDLIISAITKQTNKEHLKDHLKEKFVNLYDRYGAHAVMGMFYTELDKDLRNALVDYALKEYAPRGMRLTDEDKQLIGI